MSIKNLIAACLLLSAVGLTGYGAVALVATRPVFGAEPAADAPAATASGLPVYVPRFHRARPVVAVVAENSYTELTDYVVPYGVLAASGVAQVMALATQPGPIQMFPALRVQPQATVAEFDRRFPEGADYVLVPAVHRAEDPALLAWVRSQASKGATVVGICDGVWVLAHAGLLNGRRAVGHWYSFDDLAHTFPNTRFVRNMRYLADGPVVTTTGVTASIPVSIALVEAIAGHQQAMALAQAMGVAGWGTAHHSEQFRLNGQHMLTAAANWLSFWRHEEIAVPVAQGVDEIGLALAADAYSRTYRSSAFSLAATADRITTRRGLVIYPDRVARAPAADRTVTLSDSAPPVAALDSALRAIEQTYGAATAAFVALQIEYPRP